MSPSIMELPPRIRGRALFRLTLFQRFHAESDHSEGVFIFAGFTIHWFIWESDSERVLYIQTNEDTA